MAEISYNQIFDGVSLALHRAFPAVKIHGRTVKQDLHAGDFNVLPITTGHTSQMGNRAKRGTTFDVIYYPTDAGAREECLNVADRLPGALGTITTPNGDKVNCLKVESNITDDALHCIVDYPHFVYTPIEGDEMETLNISQ